MSAEDAVRVRDKIMQLIEVAAQFDFHEPDRAEELVTTLETFLKHVTDMQLQPDAGQSGANPSPPSRMSNRTAYSALVFLQDSLLKDDLRDYELVKS